MLPYVMLIASQSIIVPGAGFFSAGHELSSVAPRMSVVATRLSVDVPRMSVDTHRLPVDTHGLSRAAFSFTVPVRKTLI